MLRQLHYGNILRKTKNEMFYGFEKEYTSFEIFSKAIADDIDYYKQQKNSSQNKMNASRKVPGSIHDVKLIIQFNRQCPENWVHITSPGDVCQSWREALAR